MPTANEIRSQFISFFKEKHGHTFVPSSSVVPLDDPTLMFTNAGMNQFKDVFLGTGSRPYRRAVNSQKCIRASGKHNDLEDVGRDTYHHTFFEMLGNWSFGDYYKAEAIRWAWELLTEVWGLEKSRLHATVFGGEAPGSQSGGLEADVEAEQLWKQVTDINPKHIHRFGKKDNFWMMGETGPCGPCTEIHYDRTPDLSGGSLVNAGDARVMEIWNLVFIQYNRDDAGVLTPLPAKHVDTGMGFERITAVLQKKNSNYDTDVFAPLMAAIEGLTKQKYTAILDDQKDVGFRVIADHLRTLTFAITDGALPSNKGRGSVLRSILRRAVRFGWQVFGQREPFIYKLVPTLVDHMGGAFPELKSNPSKVAEVIKGEEADFLKTIDRGLSLFEDAAKRAEGVSPPSIPGEDVFNLYTTYGFPPDLTRQMAQERGLAVDEAGYAKKIKEHEEVSRGGWVTFDLSLDMNLDLSGLAATVTHDSELVTSSTILGWAENVSDGSRLLRAGQMSLHSKGAMVLSESCYPLVDISHDYAEVVGDNGRFTVRQVERRGNVLLHFGTIEKGTLSIGENVSIKITRRNQPRQGKPQSLQSSGSLPTTDDRPKWQGPTGTGKILGWIADNAFVEKGSLSSPRQGAERTDVGLVLDTTCFYAESGGQVGDTGFIATPTGKFQVTNTVKLGNAVVHLGEVVEGSLEVGQQAKLSVSSDREFTRKNHTATHLLHWALRKTLGDHVEQRGSKVKPEEFTFDFSHDAPVSREQRAELERLVNEKIYADLKVDPVELPITEAKKLPGVRAFFGDKYGDVVRVVTIGDGFSREFCGGTHLDHTGQAGFFKIVSEEGVAKGVRRLTCVTAKAAVAAVQQQEGILSELTGRLKCQPADLPTRFDALQDEIKKLQAQLKKGASADLGGTVDKLFAAATEAGGAKVVVGEIPAGPDEAIREQVDRLKQKMKSGVILLGWVPDEGKVSLLAAVTDDLQGKVQAGKLVGQVAPLVGGKGGGRPALAQAGGKDAAKLGEALAEGRKLVAAALGG